MSSLPPTLYNFATHNEDAAVEMLVIDAIGGTTEQPLRVLSVAGCGTHVLTMCSSPDVASVDAVDVSPTQLHLARLLRAAFEGLDSVDELATFIGNSGTAAERRAAYPRVREHTGVESGAFWDENLATVEAGVMCCGGAERCQARMRAALPTDDLAVLARDPEAVATALRTGMSMAALQENIVGMPQPAMEALVEHGVPMIAKQASRRLAQGIDRPDFMLEVVFRGRFPMDPVDARPLFLQPDTFSAVRQNGCGPGRLSFHAGPVQSVGAELARTHGVFDLIDLSNILDMAPPDAAAAIVGGVKAAARPGAAVLCRSYRPAGTLRDLFSSQGLVVDEALSARALAAESSFFIDDVCIARTE